MRKFLQKLVFTAAAFSLMLAANGQNLLSNGNCEDQGSWEIVQGDLARTYTVDFGSAATIKGGSGGAMKITFQAKAGTGSYDAEVFVFQKLDVTPGKTYKFSAAFNNQSASLTDAWVEIFWYEGTIKDQVKINENSIAKFGTWTGAVLADGFDGLIDTSAASVGANSKRTSYFQIPDTANADSIYFGINIGTWGTNGDFDLLFDNIAVYDSISFGNAIGNIEVGKLLSNNPNPFNRISTISYTVPENGNVKIKVYNILGSEVATLVNNFKAKGSYSVDFNASKLNSGIYICKYEINGLSTSKKMLLIK